MVTKLTGEAKKKHDANVAADAAIAKNALKVDYDVENLKEATTMIAKMGLGIVQARDDGKWSFSDALYFGDFLKAIPAAVKDFDKIDDEIKDMDAEEVEEVIAHVAGQLELFEITDDIRTWIIECMKTAVKFVQLVKQGMIIFAKKEAAE